MASKENAVALVNPHQLASVIRSSRLDKVLIVDSRSFFEYNDRHIQGAVNVCCSKLVKRRLQQDKVCVRDFLQQNCRLDRGLIEYENGDVIVYDQSSISPESVNPDSFLHLLLHKLVHVFRQVFLLSGGFLKFQACYGDFCEDKSRLLRSSSSTLHNMTSLSQPCLPITNVGPTRILSFLYLGSQQDAHNQELLSDFNITYEVNVSTNCPKPDFIQDSRFLRLPVNDSYGEKLLPYFVRATQFIDKVRETNGSVLVHCLAGISRSPTVAIAYVMRHLQMTFDDAFRYVKSKRSSISPNFNFLGQLLEYERQLREEEVLDSSVGDVTNCLQPSCQATAVSSPRCPATTTTTATSPAPGRERCLSRSISLSLSLKSPGLETVPHSCSPSPSSSDHLLKTPFGFAGLAVDEVDGSSKSRPILTADLSPTAALARLSFEAYEAAAAAAAAAAERMPSPVESEIKESSSSYLVVSRRKHHTREEIYRSLRQRMSSTTSSSSSTEMSHSYYSSKQKTETTSSRSSSSMVLTVSQSQRVQSSSPLSPATPSSAATTNQRNHRWKPTAVSNPLATASANASPSSHCSEISVHIEGSKAGQQEKIETERVEEESEQVDDECEPIEIRRRGAGFPRPHSDIGGGYLRHIHHPLQHTRSVPRRTSYAPSEASYSSISDDMLLSPTPSSPPPPSSSSSCSSHHLMAGLLSPQGNPCSNSSSGNWGGVVSPGLYARSDSVTTSGLGSEISDSEMGQSRADLDALSLCSGMSGTVRSGVGGGGSIAGSGFLESETDFASLPPDDGVFTELFSPPPARLQPPPPPRGGSSRPSRPSSLLGIIPARDLEWKPSPSSSSCSDWMMTSLDSSPTSCNRFPLLRKARPTSLLNPIDPSAPCEAPGTLGDLATSANPSSGQDSATRPGEDDLLPDSATVFQLWRQREAAMEQQLVDRSSESSNSLSVRRRSSKDITSASRLQHPSVVPECSSSSSSTTSSTSNTSTTSVSSKRKSSSEIPRDGAGFDGLTVGPDGGSPPAVVEKRRSGTREAGELFMMDGLYRFKSCPDIVDQMKNDQYDGQLPKSIHLELTLSKNSDTSSSNGISQHSVVQLRVARSRRDSQTQRYSCGALDGNFLVATNSNSRDALTNCSPNSASPLGCGSEHNSNTSLNCFSVIEVS
ncbi:serine-rich adhesin for platelets isoform X2 [Daphnia magna]|uniref:serine-rich adhesin for platelets isoform X2 n=1 Tax=Daphnia magna TaxID=35525 RepID=UPI001E1BC387|nr:serine-rich adhesin for platelets isoform X2 [Daphnia magna]